MGDFMTGQARGLSIANLALIGLWLLCMATAESHVIYTWAAIALGVRIGRM